MLRLEIGNEKVALRLAMGEEGDPPVARGILVESIRDVQAGREHEYLVAPTILFEFAVNDGPPRVSSRDLEVTGHEIIAAGRAVRVHASSRGEQLSFQLAVATDGSEPAIVVELTVTNDRADVDVLACPECGGRLRLIAFIADEKVAARILDHLGLDSTGPPAAPPRRVPEEVEPPPSYDLPDPVYEG